MNSLHGVMIVLPDFSSLHFSSLRRQTEPCLTPKKNAIVHTHKRTHIYVVPKVEAKANRQRGGVAVSNMG